MSWIGGKKLLRDAVLCRFPLDYDRFIEVFGGGGVGAVPQAQLYQ